MLKRNLIILFALAVGFTFAVFAASSGNDLNSINPPDTKNAGAPDEITMLQPFDIPAVDWITIDSTPLPDSFLNGSIVLINFWATWCPPCVVELPELVEFTDARNDINLLLVSGDQTNADVVQFMNETLDEETAKKMMGHERIFVIHDKDGKITRSQFQTFKLPETYIIQSGRVTGKVMGPLTPAGYEYLDKLRNQGF